MSAIAAPRNARVKRNRHVTREQVADPWGLVEMVESHGVDLAEACRRTNTKLVTGQSRMRVAAHVPVAERFYDDPFIDYFHVSACAEMPGWLRVMVLTALSRRAADGRPARGDDARAVSKLHRAGVRLDAARVDAVLERLADPLADLREGWLADGRDR